MDAEQKYYTVEEVNLVLPELQARVDEVQHLHERIQELGTELLEREGRAADESAATRHGEQAAGRPAEVAEQGMTTAQVQFLARQIEDRVEAILRLGGVPKDLGQGLVDFPGLVGGEAVWLCWKSGETRVRFYHGRHEGFSGRRPLPPVDQLH